MKNILIDQIKLERCNASALGAFNASVGLIDQSFKIEAISVVKNLNRDIETVERNIEYWKENGSRQEIQRYTQRKEQLQEQIKILTAKYNL